MAVVLLNFVQKAQRVAKQALGTRAGKPAWLGLPRETHIVAHCLRIQGGYTFTELIGRLALMFAINNIKKSPRSYDWTAVPHFQ